MIRPYAGWRVPTTKSRISLADFSPALVRKMVEPAFPLSDGLTFEPIPGATTNLMLKLEMDAFSRPYVLRAFHSAAACEWERKTLALLTGRVPAPEILYAESTGRAAGVPYIITDWKEGEPIDAVIQARPDFAYDIGDALGRILARLHAHSLPQPGKPGDLEIDEETGRYRAILEATLSNRVARARLGGNASRIDTLVATNYDLLDTLSRERSLVHGKLDPEHILVWNDNSSFEIDGIIDWDTAHGGSPAQDFGVLIRHLGAESPVMQGVAAGYRAAGGNLPFHWVAAARILDLSSLIVRLSDPTLPGEAIGGLTRQIALLLDRWRTVKGP